MVTGKIADAGNKEDDATWRCSKKSAQRVDEMCLEEVGRRNIHVS